MPSDEFPAFPSFLRPALERGLRNPTRYLYLNPTPIIMKRFSAVIFLAALGLLIKPALADETSQRALAAKLIDMTNGKDTMRAGFDAVIDTVIENMHQHGMPQAGVDEIKAAVNKWYDSEINFDDIRPKMVDLYVKDFSEDDLKQILAFYESPVGQKAIKNLPSVMREGAMIAQEYTKAKIPSLNAQLTPILVKYRDQMESAGGAAPAGGGEGEPGGAPAPAPAP
jgi:hypothetical protein